MNNRKKVVFAALTLLFFVACNRGNVKVDRGLEKYFTDNKVEGSFGMFDNGHGQFTLHNYNGYKDSAYLPASTFKMVNALIAVETGVAKNDSTIIPWDGVKRDDEALNKDLMLTEAFALSSVSHFQTLAKTIGSGLMVKYLDSLKMGNYLGFHDDTSLMQKNIDMFWLNNTFKVKPDEMLGFVKKLYFKQLPGFQKRSHEIVNKMMLRESQDTTYALSYKTGLGYTRDNRQVAWVAGWIEENHHPYFFVLNTIADKDKQDLKNITLDMLKKILSDKGFFKGKK